MIKQFGRNIRYSYQMKHLGYPIHITVLKHW